MKHLLLTLLALAATILSTQAQDLVCYGPCQQGERLVPWGTAKTETFNAAIRIADPGLAGSQISAIRLLLNAGPEALKDCRAFVTHDLKLTSGKADPDVCSVEFTPADEGWTLVTLPEPVTLSGEPLYVGYTITVGKLDAQGGKEPLMVALGCQRDGLYLGTSRTYRKWEDMGVSLSRTLPLEVMLSGQPVVSEAAGICYLDDQRVKRGAQSAIQATIANHGTSPIHSLDYTYTAGGATLQGHIDLPKPLTADHFGARYRLSFLTPALPQLGTEAGSLTITQVNGSSNDDLAPEAHHTLEAVKVVTVKRPLLEEFTGTWCGWCPRGYMGLLLLNERYPDEFIGASYHQGDVMSITDNFPVDVQGFPAANLDRSHDTDAYRGDTNRDMGIEETWLKACQEDTPANVYVQARLSDDQSQLLIDAQYEFAIDRDDANYGVAYLVTADSLCGTTGDWLQHSYFPGVTDYGPEMDMFTQGPEYLFLAYDDVVIAQSGSGGATITGVIPSAVHEEELFSHEYAFTLATMRSLKGNHLVQDNAKLNVIALLYDRTECRVVNCAKAHVSTDSGQSLHPAFSDASNDAPSYFTLDGKRLSAPQRGLTIVRKGGKAEMVITR